MPWIADNPEAFAGQRVHNGQCVRYVQEACGAPHTSYWRRGCKVRSNNIPEGTAIATFDPNEHYGNHTNGRSRAAILVSEQDNGLLVWDQWLRHPVSQRLIRFRGGKGRPVNDGDAFHVIEASD